MHRSNPLAPRSPVRRTRATLIRMAAAVLATVVLTPAARAQTPVTASIAVTATVVIPLSLTVTHGLDFGKLLPGSSKGVLGTSLSGARAEIVGSGGSAVVVTLSMPTALTLTGGTATLPVAGWTYYTAPTASLTGATGVVFDATMDRQVTITLPGTGTVHFYVALGATAQAAAGQTPGDYAATGRITAVYADL